MPAMILPLVVWILAGELFFFLLANKKGVSRTMVEGCNVEHNLKPSRVLGQFSSANALEEFDDCNLLRNASQVQPPSVPNANGQMSQGNGPNTSYRYVFNENED
jgi:hypothetical protein